MPLAVLVVFIISPTEFPDKFGEHTEKTCNKSQNKGRFTMYKELAPPPSFPKNNASGAKRNVRIAGLEMKPKENLTLIVLMWRIG